MYAVYLVISEHVTCCITCYVCAVYMVISEHVTCCNTCYVCVVYLVISASCYLLYHLLHVCCLPGDIRTCYLLYHLLCMLFTW